MKLTVKTPNQGYEDVHVDCELDWTVKRLKEYLQDVYPSKPCSSSQKLIYLGRLLQDHLSLKEVFGEWGARTLHIVCNENEKVVVSTPAPPNPPSTAAGAQDTQAPVASGLGTDGLRQRAVPTSSQMPTSQGSAFTFPQYSSPMQSQMSAQFQGMQTELAQQHQLRMQQYYQQLYQWQQAMGNHAWANMGTNPWNFNANITATPPNTPYNHMPQPSFAFQVPPPAQTEPPERQAQQPPAPHPFPQPQPEVQFNEANRNAAPGGIQEDEEDNDNPRNRDWLDWLYTSLRAFMLLSIVYFYSSTSRFVMVTILAFLLYLYQNGWFTPRRVHVPPPVPEQPQEPQRDEQNEDIPVDNDQQAASDQENSDTTRDQEEPPPNAEPEPPSFFRTLCVFCVSFVTSLVPNPPEVG